jgi:5-methylcytosine-specific restriction endonuclease McrA
MKSKFPTIEEIMRGKKSEKPQKGLTPARRAALVLKFSKGRCFECEKKFDYSGLDVHHIKERSKGGSNKLTNLTILCAGCHRALKFGYIDRSKLKPIMKPKPTKPKKATQKKTKKKRRRPETSPLEGLNKRIKEIKKVVG